MSLRIRISTSEAVSLLEEAQCATPSETSSVLQKLTLHLHAPHPSVTSALHDLLQIHPLQTIPHVPTLIPGTPSVVAQFVESFSDLLSADRALLVPIIGALSDLPLSATHTTQSRATLHYALSVVDSHDLPAVVRALARLCANVKTSASARWAAIALRNALAVPPADDVIPVLTHVLEDVCRPGNSVGCALRLQAGVGIVSWLDIVVWYHAFKAKNGPYAMGYNQAASSLSSAVKGSLLTGNVERTSMAIRTAAPALQNGDGIRAMVSIIVDELASFGIPSFEVVVNFATLVCSLVDTVPASARAVVQELLVPERSRFVAAEAALLGIADILTADAKQMAMASCNPRVKIAALGREGDDASAWSGVFVSLRKTLVFGMSEERVQALELARQIVWLADPDIVGELLVIMDSSVPSDLGDEIAVGFLEIVTAAVLRGIVPLEDSCRTLKRRIEEQCPSGMVKEGDGQGENGDPDRRPLHIDIGLIWDQDPAAIATVVSSTVSLMLASRGIVSSDGISLGLLNVLCLVPIVCIPLYTAVEDCTLDFDATLSVAKSFRAAKPKPKDIPDAIRETEDHDLATAITSFAAAMSAIIGILNSSSVSLARCQRVLNSRGRRCFSRDARDQHAIWNVLERLTEFDRMLNALLLGYEVLQMKTTTGRKAKRERKSKKGSKGKGENCNAGALHEASAIRSTVLTGLTTTVSSLGEGIERMSNVTPGEYPRLSLQAILFSLVAVPDEEGIIEITNGAICKQTRDTELTRIDRLLLRQLLVLMTGRFSKELGSHGKDEGHWKNANSEDFGAVSSMKQNDLNCSKRIQDAISEVLVPSFAFPRIDMDINSHKSFFIFKDDEFTDEENDEEEQGNTPVFRWACPKPDRDSWCAEYLRSSASMATQMQWGSQQIDEGYAARVINSPAFASLLLDRAALYVAVARNGRRNEMEDTFLSSVTTVAGLALGCLNALFRGLPSSVTSRTDGHGLDLKSNSRISSDIQAFFDSMEQHLKTGVPSDEKNVSEGRFKSSCTGTWKVIQILHWISRVSIDTVVSALALKSRLILSELGCCRPEDTRHAILSSLTTVYEYDINYLWSPDDTSLLFKDSFGEWSLRRRGDAGKNTISMTEKDILTSEPAPWVPLLSKGLNKQRRINQYRLHMFFEGMNVSNALLEASGWIREIAGAMFCKNTSYNKRSGSGEEASFRAENAMEVPDATITSKVDSKRCTTLLETNDFTEVVTTLMQLVQTSLSTTVSQETFNIHEALSFNTSAIGVWQAAIRILCGILRLNIMCRESLNTQSGDQAIDGAPSRVDDDFDHYMIGSFSSVMQMVCSRISELCSWCSDADYVSDIPHMSEKVVDLFKKFVGGAALAVSYCMDLSALMKSEYSSAAKVPADHSGDRIPSKRRAAGEEHVSRARKIIPRLSAQCDSVTKETQKLANVMGFKTKKALFKLAPPPLEDDPDLCFGVGLDVTDRNRGEEDMKGIDENGNGDTAATDGTDAEMVVPTTDSDVAMRSSEAMSRVVKENNAPSRQAKPVTIRFK